MTRILVVDDNDKARYLLEVLLQGNGYEVATAANGEEALEAARKGLPDLVISDILMPVMDGFALCRRWMVDESLRRVPFVFYTATYTDRQDEEFALGLGAARFVVKPAEPDALLELVGEVLADESAADRPPVPPAGELDDAGYLREYNATLVRKLETKMRQLDVKNATLERQLTKIEESREAQARLTAILESTPDFVGTARPDGRVMYVNAGGLRMMGIDGEGGSTPATIPDCSPDWANQVIGEKGIPTAVRDGYWTGETALLHRDGSEIPVSQVIVAYYDGSGEVVYLSTIARDMRETREVEEERDKLESRLRQAQKMEAVGQLAGGIAHDFNNILTAILGNVEIASWSDDPADAPSEPVADSLDQIRRSAERAADLTHQLLAFSRQQVLKPRVLDVAEVLRDLESMLRRLLTENIELAITHAPEPYLTTADRTRIEQIIVNLVVNARDAMPGGGRLALEVKKVTLEADYAVLPEDVKAGPFILLAVSDTGDGMDAVTQDRIFEPFFTTKALGQGTGLGLSTVYGIVKQSGAHISVYSEPNHGTTFRIYFPEAEGVAQKAAAKAEEMKTDGTETLLLCEDDEAIREVMGRMLRAAGYTVLSAGTGEEALATLAEHDGPLDLFIADVVLPDTDGKQLAGRIAEKRPGLQVLYVSGYTADMVAKHGILGEDIELLEKPFTRTDLLRGVRRLLDRTP